jgi:hypothetical protein
MNPPIRALAAWCGSAALLVAGGTRNWEHSSQADFERATVKKLSVRSDGRLTLAPIFKELFDPSTSHLWAVAQDSRGRLFAGGGGDDGKARVFQIEPSGGGRRIAELAGLEVQCIAVDAQDRVYAATSPDGKVYRVRDGAAPEVFYDPKAKYIWAMAFDRAGNLYVGTGDKGEIHRVSAAGAGSVFYRTQESHARSLAIDANGNLFAGTDPGGLIFRIGTGGEGFVVHQASKREITALAPGPNGSVYVAAAGAKPTVVAPAPPPPPPPAVPAAAAPVLRPVTPPIPSVGSAPSGGSEVLRIEADGYPRKLWTHSTDVAYALAFDASGKLLIGTGNKGAIHRLEDDLLSTLVLSATPTQVTGLLSGRGGAVYAVTGNIGKVFQLGPEFEREGSIESETMDAGFFAQWGRINYGGTLNGGSIKLETRSGNLESPRQNWSPWAAVTLNSSSGRVASPPARFVQYRVTLAAGPNSATPGVASIDLAYLPKNVAPVVEVIDSTPANYRFPPQSLSLTTPAGLTLPALTRTPGRSSGSGATASGDSPASSMTYAKGHIGARWLAKDDNGDQLLSTVEIRGEKETEWRILKADIRERNLSWDSTAFPDGEYLVRVTVSDSPSNPPHMALTGRLESYPFVIDNTPPRVTGLAATRTGARIEARWRAVDALNTIAKAEYSFDGGDWKVVEPTTRLSDSQQHDYVLAIDAAASGEHVVAVRVADYFDNVAVERVLVPRGQ